MYLDEEGSLNSNNLNALYLCLKILDSVGEQFSVRQAEKMDRKNKQAIMQAVQPVQQSSRMAGDNAKDAGGMSMAAWSSSRQQRAAVRQTIKYFESSEEEEEEEEDEGEAEGAQPQAARHNAPKSDDERKSGKESEKASEGDSEEAEEE